jgi:CDGSH-type Zn-finger protein
MCVMSSPAIPQKEPYVQEIDPGTYWWCSCGLSQGQPFCDGSHKGTDFTPVKVEVTEKRKLAFCGCKHSKSGAMCDGSHAGLQ